jgi:hypothetical protein
LKAIQTALKRGHVILRVFENRVLKKIFDLKERKWRETGEDCITRSIITCTLHEILLLG